MYLITAMRKPCDDCSGKGQRIDESTACPNCLGRGERGVDIVIEGRLYQLFPEEMVDIEDKAHARAILALTEFRGVVEVKERRTGNRIEVDADAAIALSKQRIRRTYETRLAQYIQEQREGPMAAGKPPVAPTGIYAEAVQVLGVDLEKLGINPPAYQVERALAGQASGESAEVAALRSEVSELKDLVSKLTHALAGNASRKPAPKKKPQPVTSIAANS